MVQSVIMAKFILQTSYGLSVRRIIRLSINPKTNFDEQFVQIFIYLFIPGNIAKIQKPVSPIWKLRQKPSTFRLDMNLETDNPSKTNYPSVSTCSRRANRRISFRRIFLHNSSQHRIYTRDELSVWTDNSSLVAGVIGVY